MQKRDINILVADDNFANRSLLQAILGKTYNIIQAKDGQEAWSILEKERIDIAILDLVMPNIDGFTLLDAIHRHEKYSHIPVVIISANDNKQNQIQSLDYGAVDILGKPFDPEVITHRIKNLVDRIEMTKIHETQDRITMDLARKMDILEMSQMDKVTGIYNRETFSSILSEMLVCNPDVQFDLLRIDIDRFKVFNDTFGVGAGDNVLKKLGAIFKDIHSRLTIYGRWHADHFIIVTPRDNYDAEKLMKIITKKLQKGFMEFEFVLRMGIYQIDDPNLDPTILCDRAMLALKTLKDDYTHHIAYYNESMRTALIEEQRLINEMEGALASGQFQVYIQPQYNYATHRLSGAEALVRWIHPEKGIIAPGVFVPIFEKNGFITKIDVYIWDQTCRLLRNWIDEGLQPVPVSVNISRKDLYNPDLCKILCELIQKYDLSTDLLRLEITESACMNDPDQLIAIVSTLKNHGFCVEMDDFGSGFSSLNTLKDVPVDILKLDMKFLGAEQTPDITQKSERGGTILSSIVRMASRLNLPIIAEGVETLEQADFLKSIGCLFMQGYYFAKPVPAEEYRKILKDNPSHILEVSKAAPSKTSIDFLDYSVQSSELFDKYVGAAAIIEYSPASYHIEILRMNNKFISQLDLTIDTIPEEKDFKKKIFGNEGINDMIKLLDEALASKTETVGELVLPGHGEPVHLFARVQHLSDKPLSHIFFLNIENISGRSRLIHENEQLRAEIEELKAKLNG